MAEIIFADGLFKRDLSLLLATVKDSMADSLVSCADIILKLRGFEHTDRHLTHIESTVTAVTRLLDEQRKIISELHTLIRETVI